ncbi:uncharacterized protein LOC142771732 [Rhipicephalus microplus]|uniref:uncharacterized protein LOC142771732 n=1 Tax=Rhipicephalus microplus TaxID=6941 RepID=UPI003F6AAE95
MPRHYYRSNSDSDSKNAQGAILFCLSLIFLTALVVSMVTFAMHIKREMGAADRQEQELPDGVWANATRMDTHADANHTVEHTTRRGVTVTVVAETTSTMAARRRNVRRRGHDVPRTSPERRKQHTERKPADGAPDQRPRRDSDANVPQAEDHNAETTHHIQTAPPTTTTPTTTTKESTTIAPTNAPSPFSTKTSTTTPAATAPATSASPAKSTVTTATTKSSTSSTMTSPTSSKSLTTQATKPSDDATPEASITIRRTRAIIKALTVERHTSPTQPTTSRLTRKIIAAKEVVPGRGAKAIQAEDGAEAVTRPVMEAPMVAPAIQGGHRPETAVGSFRRLEAETSATAKAGLESSPPDKTLAKISETPPSKPSPSPKRDSKFTLMPEPRTSHRP